uniref:Lipoprotein n=1 Tax=Ditylenchus dipsaci TaxID=166011 RepID=A0A915EJX2_9BILA
MKTAVIISILGLILACSNQQFGVNAQNEQKLYFADGDNTQAEPEMAVEETQQLQPEQMMLKECHIQLGDKKAVFNIYSTCLSSASNSQATPTLYLLEVPGHYSCDMQDVIAHSSCLRLITSMEYFRKSIITH